MPKRVLCYAFQALALVSMAWFWFPFWPAVSLATFVLFSSMFVGAFTGYYFAQPRRPGQKHRPLLFNDHSHNLNIHAPSK